jgi:uncharacterized SAM-binding protein YcdF (DUF218 family)
VAHHEQRLQRAMRVALSLAALSLIGFLGVTVHIARYAAALVGSARPDAIIVLGAAAYGDKPSPVFAGRLEYALELLHTGRVARVIVAGGRRADQPRSEAEVGARYLEARGVAPGQVLQERSSRTTLENLCFAQTLGAQHGLLSFALVTDPLHAARAMRLARDIGLRAVPAATPYTRFRTRWAQATFLVREAYLYSVRLVLGARPCA